MIMDAEESFTNWSQLVCVTDTDTPPFLIGKNKFTIGRTKECDICHENNMHVSGTHCYILRDADGKVFLYDTSTNGTLLNSTIKLTKGQRQEITHGDEFFVVHKKGEDTFNIGYVFQDLGRLKEEEEQDSEDFTFEYDNKPQYADATIVDDSINEIHEEDTRTTVKRRLATPKETGEGLLTKRTKTDVAPPADSCVGAGDYTATSLVPPIEGCVTKDYAKSVDVELNKKEDEQETGVKGEEKEDRGVRQTTVNKEELGKGCSQDCEKGDVFADTLTCIICQELFHDCISLQPCMHSFCSGCYSEWMAHSSDCPSCRGSVERINKNHIVNNLVDAYLKEHPEKCRPEEEIKDLDAKNKITRDMLYPKPRSKSSSAYEDSDVDDNDEEDAPIPAPILMGGTIFGFGTPLFGAMVNAYRAVCRQCPGQSDANKLSGILGTAINANKGILTGNLNTVQTATAPSSNTASTSGGTVPSTLVATNITSPDQSSTSRTSATEADNEEYRNFLKRDMKTIPTPPAFTCAVNQNHILCQCCLQIFPDRRAEQVHNPNIPPQQCAICYKAYCHAYWGCRKADCNGCLAKFQGKSCLRNYVTLNL